MWKTKKNYDLRYRKSLHETINGKLSGEQKSAEQLLKLWKDRPRRAKEEIPKKAFEILKKQHSIEKNDSARWKPRRNRL